MTSEVTVSEELLSLGLTPNLTGFRYSKFIITKILNSKTPLSMSALLLSCAHKNECSTSRVERGVRTAIDIMNNNGCSAGYFGPLKKITVSAFVFTIAEKIRNKEIKNKELENNEKNPRYWTSESKKHGGSANLEGDVQQNTAV